ncbi:MAG TPA: glutamate-cysteine ligase family protein [Jatrophihabitans sp.]|nr:glutamate-cysteine ligase family protein [Jatrophihabitans sp.]
MGEDVDSTEFTGRDRQRYREKVRRCLDVFARMLTESKFDFDHPMTGLEIEFNLIDAEHNPAMKNAAVLEAIANPDFQTELGQFNIEINVKPRELHGQSSDELERDLRASLNDAEHRAASQGAHIVMIGILPTLLSAHLSSDVLSDNARYAMLQQQIFAARGEDLHIDIDGPERLSSYSDSIAPEAACTSVQFHLQVSPQEYANNWNAAQAMAGVQLALGANSPYLFGKELWRETRVVLFEQSTDTRPAELKTQGVRPRVWFGERWINSIFDQFEENVSYFPAILPVCDVEDPVEVLNRGDIPQLQELRMHNGTIYRWNRPVYDVYRNKPHLRVENRVLPAGPTVVDILANGAFYYGLLRTLAEEDRPIWTRLSFAAAADNFYAGARHGINATLYWPGLGEVPATELVLRRLLPMAYEGLARWGVAGDVQDRLLGIIEQRCITHLNGAEWQTSVVHRLEKENRNLDRPDALRQMLGRYVENMHTNQPVHTWEI